MNAYSSWLQIGVSGLMIVGIAMVACRAVETPPGGNGAMGGAKAPAVAAPASQPGKAIVLSHVRDASKEKMSYADTGFAEEFDRPEGADKVVAVELYGSRYGTMQAPKENFHVYLLDENKKVIADVPVPYGRINRGDMKWHTLPVPPTKVPPKFHVALFFNAERTKGVYVGKDMDVKQTHSLVGKPGEGFEPVDGQFDWMIRVRLAGSPATQSADAKTSRSAPQ